MIFGVFVSTRDTNGIVTIASGMARRNRHGTEFAPGIGSFVEGPERLVSLFLVMRVFSSFLLYPLPSRALINTLCVSYLSLFSVHLF